MQKIEKPSATDWFYASKAAITFITDSRKIEPSKLPDFSDFKTPLNLILSCVTPRLFVNAINEKSPPNQMFQAAAIVWAMISFYDDMIDQETFVPVADLKKHPVSNQLISELIKLVPPRGAKDFYHDLAKFRQNQYDIYLDYRKKGDSSSWTLEDVIANKFDSTGPSARIIAQVCKVFLNTENFDQVANSLANFGDALQLADEIADMRSDFFEKVPNIFVRLLEENIDEYYAFINFLSQKGKIPPAYLWAPKTYQRCCDIAQEKLEAIEIKSIKDFGELAFKLYSTRKIN